MTFIAPVRPADHRATSFRFGRKAPKPSDRLWIADEDGARRALGSVETMPVPAMAGISIEHLARITFG